jgi:hypothetical protein
MTAKGDELLQRLEASEGADATRFSAELMDDFGDLVGTRAARAVADAVMFDPEFVMDEAFRKRLIERFFTS